MASFAEAVVVTATRGDRRTTSPAAPVSILTASDLALAPPTPLDDVLKVVPGFSLFRRTTSRSANPTTQGAGLRGLSASGASRALVLADGEVLNDPFGGWVYWDRVPAAAIDRVEVVRGGASDLYGADALVGVVQVVTRKPTAPTLRVEAAAASHDSGRLSVFGGGSRGGWTARRPARPPRPTATSWWAKTTAAPSIRRPAANTASCGRMSAIGPAPAFAARLGGDLFDENRENGTPLQTNSTDLRQLRAAIEGQAGSTSWRVTGQVGDQTYRQVFSSIAGDRMSETLTVQQRVPASQQAAWVSRSSRASAGIDLLAGADTREVSATNIEHAFFPDGRLRAHDDHARLSADQWPLRAGHRSRRPPPSRSAWASGATSGRPTVTRAISTTTAPCRREPP